MEVGMSRDNVLAAPQAPHSPAAAGRKAAVEGRWHAMRAYKNERLAEERLSSAEGMCCFVAKRYAMRTFHGRKRPCAVPVIPGLVFVRATRARIAAFKREVYGGLQFVMSGREGRGGPLVVPDGEMESFIRVCEQYGEDTRFHRPEDIHVGKGTRVRVHGGAFDGVEGIFVRVAGRRSRRLVVLLTGVMAVSVTVQPEYLEIL